MVPCNIASTNYVMHLDIEAWDTYTTSPATSWSEPDANWVLAASRVPYFLCVRPESTSRMKVQTADLNQWLWRFHINMDGKIWACLHNISKHQQSPWQPLMFAYFTLDVVRMDGLIACVPCRSSARPQRHLQLSLKHATYMKTTKSLLDTTTYIYVFSINNDTIMKAEKQLSLKKYIKIAESHADV